MSIIILPMETTHDTEAKPQLAKVLPINTPRILYAVEQWNRNRSKRDDINRRDRSRYARNAYRLRQYREN